MSTSAKVARDTWLIFQRQSLVAFRTPVAFGLGLFQPVMYVLLWAPVLKEALRNTGVTSYSDAFRTYVPGLVTVMAVYGGLFAGFGLLAEIRSGIIERGRVTPVSRASLMLGRALSDVATMFTGALLITLFAVAVGMRVGPGDLLFALLIILLLELMMVSLGYAVSMSVRHEAVLMSVIDTAIQPVVLLSRRSAAADGGAAADGADSEVGPVLLDHHRCARAIQRESGLVRRVGEPGHHGGDDGGRDVLVGPSVRAQAAVRGPVTGFLARTAAGTMSRPAPSLAP